MDKIDFAIEVAAKAHRDQVRKQTDIPYITHPISIGMTLQKQGYSEELIIAGILHDTIEDTPIDIDYIKDHFGDRVASIVEGCSEPDKSLPWEERKEHTIEHLKTAPFEVKIVSCADKLHNIGCIARDYKRIGDKVWERFNRGKEKQEWYYRNLEKSFCHQPDSIEDEIIFKEFRKEVENLFRKKTCPRCQSTDIIPIQYGYPSYDMKKEQDKGLVKIGGCMVDEDSPRWYCKNCHHEF